MLSPHNIRRITAIRGCARNNTASELNAHFHRRRNALPGTPEASKLAPFSFTSLYNARRVATAADSMNEAVVTAAN